MLSKRVPKLNQSAYTQTFYNLQLAGYYVLYYNFDLSKEELKEMAREMEEADREIVSGKVDTDVMTDSWKNNGYDYMTIAENFPYRAKLAMSQQKIKSSKVIDIACSAEMAVKYYLILVTYVLKEKYSFSWDKINEWWKLVIDFSENYKDKARKNDGMKTHHVIEYFIQECDLKINCG